MLGAYYCKAYDSKSIFDNLEISQNKDYTAHLNHYNVINMCLSHLSDLGNTYNDYIGLIKDSLKRDIAESYPELQSTVFNSVTDMLAATNDEFIFIIDEWDYIFSHNLYPENQSDFLEFLRDLLKDRPYVALAYMTGVLPIKRYSTSSALNMFQEYTMMNDPSFEKYFGFTEEEVEALCRQQTTLSMEESYWTTTGRMDEVLFFLKYNIGEVREDAIKMVNHMPVRIEIRKEYTAGQESPATKKEIYAAMIIYGLLSYSDDELRIPNKELMIEFENSLEDDDFGYVAELVRNSGTVLDATIARQGETVSSYLHNIQNSELPILKYNGENSLACVVTLAYLSARNKYNVEREEKSGKGFADFIFYPKRRNLPGIIIELKADSSPEAAILQIKNKEYSEKLRKKKVGSILAVGINYDSRKKEHQCLIEELL